MSELQIREIEENDNAELAIIIRKTLTEFGADYAGTVYFDEVTDNLFELFQQPNSVYFVAVQNGLLVGGGGIFPTNGLSPDTCELVKMYLLINARGKGYGKLIIQKCLESAAEMGFRKVYLETMPELEQAMKVYEKFGFNYLTGALGNSGHFGCRKWMLKSLI